MTRCGGPVCFLLESRSNLRGMAEAGVSVWAVVADLRNVRQQNSVQRSAVARVAPERPGETGETFTRIYMLFILRSPPRNKLRPKLPTPKLPERRRVCGKVSLPRWGDQFPALGCGGVVVCPQDLRHAGNLPRF